MHVQQHVFIIIIIIIIIFATIISLEVNVRVCGKGLELLSENGGRFEIKQLLFGDDIPLVANSEKKLCRFVKYAKEES